MNTIKEVKLSDISKNHRNVFKELRNGRKFYCAADTYYWDDTDEEINSKSIEYLLNKIELGDLWLAEASNPEAGKEELDRILEDDTDTTDVEPWDDFEVEEFTSEFDADAEEFDGYMAYLNNAQAEYNSRKIGTSTVVELSTDDSEVTEVAEKPKKKSSKKKSSKKASDVPTRKEMIKTVMREHGGAMSRKKIVAAVEEKYGVKIRTLSSMLKKACVNCDDRFEEGVEIAERLSTDGHEDDWCVKLSYGVYQYYNEFAVKTYGVYRISATIEDGATVERVDDPTDDSDWEVPTLD